MKQNKTPYANSLFEQPWWLDIVSPGQWKEIFQYDKSGNVCARMVYVQYGNKIRMPVFTQNLGIWMRTDIKNNYGLMKDLYFNLFEQIENKNSLRMRLSPENRYILPLKWMGFKFEPFFTYRITDLSNIDEIYAKINKTTRRHIRKAEKIVHIETTTNMEHLFQLLDKTYKNQNRKNPIPNQLIEKIVSYCDDSGNGQYMEAVDEHGNLHSCAYFVYDENVFYYLIGGSDAEFRESGAQALIMWEGIKLSAEKSRIFDFEGSMIEGIEYFFRQFGGVCTPYYEVRKLGFCREVLSIMRPYIKKILKYKD